ncbi:MAG TPA: carboxypeptidase regulatory-like domain-containing protein [Actinokineospora sp.]|nr:carboxypeptidase regulatory-like domain-containing protein [Actinokineospora sp.]
MITATTVFTGVATLTTPVSAAPASSTKIESAVSEALETKDSTDFWVTLSERADLSAAERITDWGQRGAAVVDALRVTADRSQAGVLAELDAAGVDHTSYYAANTVLVRGGSAALAERLAGKAEVSSILADRIYELPNVDTTADVPRVDAVEWGIAAINADDVWSTYGARGEGIVVGNIDSGVQWDHPALAAKYRGNTAAGVSHAYNWFDPARVCPTAAPCDNNGHGSHTMGTMVGSEGANQIGVAPGARWIAAKGCEVSTCTRPSLLSSGQWMLAPTDAAGANPRPDLRPHVVNNSWGGANGATVDPYYGEILRAWRAAGIFPSFSNGNSGPGCDTAGSPADNVEAYATGAFDVNGAIASFSSRGPGANGMVKPHIAAPGVAVRSSFMGGGYSSLSGTSMAGPHTSAAVALMWSAAPALVGDVAATEQLLNSTAIDTSDLTCGGTATNNNVWGEGKLDVLAAVEQSPRGPMGTVTGTVTDAATGAPIAGATVTADGQNDRVMTTNATGRYSTAVPVGDYAVTVSSFGYASSTVTVSVSENQTVTRDIALTSVPRHTVRGVVRATTGAPLAGVTVTVTGTPLAAVVSAADGSYTVPNVPEGQYQLRTTPSGCSDALAIDLTVDGEEVADFALPNRADSFGNYCVAGGDSYVEGESPVALTGDDAATTIALPFDFFFYGATYRDAHVGSNGHINFLARSTAYANAGIPASAVPNAAIYPFFDDLVLDAQSQVLTKTVGTAPNREFVIEWRNAMIYPTTTTRVDFEAVLSENGEISFRYRNLDSAKPLETGSGATVGIENATGTVALQYSLNTPALRGTQSIRFKLPLNGLSAGGVTDVNDGLPVAGAVVRALKNGAEVSRTSTGADGTYRMRLLGGDYQLEVSRPNYTTETSDITITADGTAVDFVLHTSRADLDVSPLTFLAQEGQLRTATRTLGSSGDLSLEYSLTDGASWLWVVPGSSAVKPGNSQALTIRTDPAGLLPGVHTASVTVTTNAGRTPTLTIPVTLIVPAFRVGIDSGGSGFVDGAGDTWVTDTAWTPGGFGYLSNGPVTTTKKAIAGTTDDALFQSQKESPGGYRYDNLPAGTYQVRLDFAEFKTDLTAGRRVFDVSVNGTMVLPNYDIVARVGTLAADSHEFWVTVPEGGSISVDLAAKKGKLAPVINSLRITHRPDRVS